MYPFLYIFIHFYTFLYVNSCIKIYDAGLYVFIHYYSYTVPTFIYVSLSISLLANMFVNDAMFVPLYAKCQFIRSNVYGKRFSRVRISLRCIWVRGRGRQRRRAGGRGFRRSLSCCRRTGRHTRGVGWPVRLSDESATGEDVYWYEHVYWLCTRCILMYENV